MEKMNDLLARMLSPEDLKWLAERGQSLPLDAQDAAVLLSFLIARNRGHGEQDEERRARNDAQAARLREISAALSTLGRLLDGPLEELVRVMGKVDEL